MRLWGSLLLAGLASGAVLSRSDTSNNALAACPGYKASNVKTSNNGLTAQLSLAGKACNVYGNDLKDLILEVTYENDNRLHVKIQDAGNQVYQVPASVFPRPSDKSAASSNKLKFSYKANPFSFTVARRDTGEVLFDTSAASLVFETQYLRLRTALPNDPYLYGLGEHSDPFRLNTTNYIRTLWNQDAYTIPNGANLYGDHPFYLEQRAHGAHGVFLLNSDGMDIMINQDAAGKQYLEYNSLGGGGGIGFVNFTPNDGSVLMTGVAPSGSSKTKARREKEAQDRRRRLSEAAMKAVAAAGGDIEKLRQQGFDL
ncbi:hypothetical protein NQ176_g8046 [Zarea fungicola]|uniref:Uncharacterized protein n=1 Tax=Zarea fungicola TaxID=93591 RepID=A0ACC1MV70_9HYPO|nr:hypothetical protein NQ176_g8046 [Lecanicillium fungicola]